MAILTTMFVCFIPIVLSASVKAFFAALAALLQGGI